MAVPKRTFELKKELFSLFHVSSGERPDEGGPRPNQRRERANSALRMIQRACAIKMPKLAWQNQAPHFVAIRPPNVPEVSNIIPGRSRKNRKVWCIEKSSSAE